MNRYQKPEVESSAMIQTAQVTQSIGRNSDLDDNIGLEKRSNIVDFYHNRSVLITGASGFIGKVLIEKLLRTCSSIRHIFVLIRPKYNKKPSERLQELLKSQLFDGIRNKHLEEKVIVVEGDVTQVNLGLNDQNLLRIMNEVSVIFHSAATVKFDEPLKQSVGINIAGTKNMIDVCRKIPQLAALVHISTAYANCDLEDIEEIIYPVDMNPEKLIEMANWLDQDTLQELKQKLLGPRPNTYTYTKALAEWLLVKCARDLPVVICRPSIVCASWKEPFGGWIDNVNGPTGIILGVGKGIIRSMYAESSFVADLVPVDTVINLIITLGWFAKVYNNHKQLNDAAESFTESLISSEPVSADESLEGFTDRITLVDHTFETEVDGLTLKDSDNDSNNNSNNNSINAREDDSNNNNNNSSNSNYPSSGFEAKNVKIAKANGCKDQSSNNNINLSLNSNTTINDDGYGSNSQTPDSKSTASFSSSSSLLSPISNSTPSTNRNSAIIDRAVDQRLSFVAQRRLNEQKHSAFDYKLKQFRHSIQRKLIARDLPEEIADIPVFHCTSGHDNPITWGRVQVLVISFLATFPSISTYRYPCGSFTNNDRLDYFYRFTLHYMPGYIIDCITQLFGGKPTLVKILRKFDQATKVLKAFTSKQWKFNTDNHMMLVSELMSEEDKRLFDCDLRQLDWHDYLGDYVIGVRDFILKEPMSNLKQARRNLSIVYYRNLSLQVLFFLIVAYYFIPSSLQGLLY